MNFVIEKYEEPIRLIKEQHKYMNEYPFKDINIDKEKIISLSYVDKEFNHSFFDSEEEIFCNCSGININQKSYIRYYPEEYIKELYERIVIDKYRMYNWIFNEVKKKEYKVEIEIDWKNNKIKYYSCHFKGSEKKWKKSMKKFISEFDL